MPKHCIEQNNDGKKQMKKYIVILLFLTSLQVFAEKSNLVGNSGLILVPTGYILQDSHCRFGYGQLPWPYTYIEQGEHDELFYNASIAFLPFLELMFGIVNPLGKEWGIGDRTASIRVQVLKEGQRKPALVIGTQDPFGVVAQDWAQQMNTLYFVASKSFLLPYAKKVSVHYGHGVDWLKAGVHYLQGPFGGVEWNATPYTSLLAEYDGDKVNLGIRGQAYNFQLLLVWLEGKTFTGGISYRFSLK